MKTLSLDFTNYQKEKLPAYLILLNAPILLTIYYYHGVANRMLDLFPGFQSHPLLDLVKVIFQFGSFFILFFILPLLFNRFYLKRSLSDLGLGMGDYRFGLKFVALVIPLLVLPIIYLASKMPDLRTEYPLAKILLTRHDLIFWYELSYFILYYIAWEFYFRGFLLFGLRDTFGGFMAVVIQTIPSCLIHLGKPEGETIGSIVVGIIFGMIALRTRSIWYVLLIHAAIGILTDLFIIFGK